MSWKYEITTGNFIDPLGMIEIAGYSGQPPHVNDPTAEGLKGIGPIPQGSWTATGVEFETSKHGPFVIMLVPDGPTRTRIISLGRDPESFRIHGERVQPPPGLASDGCIILPRSVRQTFSNSLDHELQVVRGGDVV